MFKFFTKRMNNISTNFSIKDLENLSGIKAHTVRIWEKRYNIITPTRTKTNIRNYSIEDLKKILNVSFLTQKGFKISKLAELDATDLSNLVLNHASVSNSTTGYENFLITCMYEFDSKQFNLLYNRLIAEFSFREVFNNLFIPLLHKIGLQWQTNTLTPAHEHFISNLIFQKLHVNIDSVAQMNYTRSEPTYILFLPQHEIHELGLLYLNYELTLKGYKTIYLGKNIPLDSINSLSFLDEKLIYMSYFTVYPEKENVVEYIDKFSDQYLNENSKLWLMGRNTQNITSNQPLSKVKIFKNLEEIIKAI